MASISERLGDFFYDIASKYISIKNGRPAKVEKEVKTGAIVNGKFRENYVGGMAYKEVVETGKAVSVQDYNARQIRRRIVFIDDPIYKL
jgi:hypothetical protein